MSFMRLIALAIGAVALSACETVSDLTSGLGTPPTASFARDSLYGNEVTGADARLLNAAFIDALNTGEARSWVGDSTAGAITPGSWSVANLQTDRNERIRAVRGDIDLRPMLETELGLYVLTRNSNVRLGPGTDYIVAQKLTSGAGVDVVGKSVEEGWMLVAVDDQILGYVSPTLMIKAPGTELELAGGPRRRALLCRDYVQRLSVPGRKDQWQGTACKTETGDWRLTAREPRDAGPAILLTD